MLSSSSHLRISAETLLAQAVHQLLSGVVVTDPHQNDNPIVYVNPGFTALTGYEAPEVIGRNCRFLQGPETDPETVVAIRQALEKGQSFRGLLQNYRKDGSPFWNGLVITPILDAKGEVDYFMGTLNDISASREQLRALAAHATKARESERTSIAREIHDELGQALTGLKMDLAWINKRLNQWMEEQSGQNNALVVANEAMLGERIGSAISLTEDTINTVRRIATQLRPSLLDDLGLEAAVEWQMKDFAARTGLRCDFKSSLGERELPPAVATAAFRILQEALTNVARHAQATQVRVHLRAQRRAGQNELRLIVRDNGRGIRDGELGDVRSLGLLGMRERALAFGGCVSVEKAKPKGTLVTAFIPLNASENFLISPC